MKQRLIFVCKTYSGDIKPFSQLVKSYQKHNVEHIPLYISVPKRDIKLFKRFVDSDITLVSDESYAKPYFTNDVAWGLSTGYLNQEICKLSFWELGVADNYMFVDSDAYFIRDFFYKDFMANNQTPYSVLVMDKDLNIERFYSTYGHWRTLQIKKIFREVGIDDTRILTCHGMAVMNGRVLEDFKDNFIIKTGREYKDLLTISPYEYSWYNAWLQKCNIIEVIPVEPFFKTFHMKQEYLFSRLRLISEMDIAGQYLGIVMNSNWFEGKSCRYKNPGILFKIAHALISRLGIR